MKCTIPEISWHNRDPVLSIDIQPSENDEFYRLASGGYDCHVLIWHLRIQRNGAVNQEIVSDLNRHQKAVNVVRWSPSGLYLASGDDDANIIIWTVKTDNIPLLEGETSDKEIWIVHKILRGHKEDVYDICWSPNGLKLISGSIDNTAIIWDFTKGLNECILSDHRGFVQGVTWDLKGQYVATLSSDRICRVFDSSGKRVIARTHKGILPLPESHPLFNKEIKYFHDDTFKSYFRRLTCSPDGNLLIAPSGCIDDEEYTAIRHTSLIFTFDNLKQPVAVLPSPKQITIAVRCCPILFELHSDGMDPVIVLPYRMIIAIATDTDVILYDTQQLSPFAHYQRIHYTRITDLTWSPDGLLLIASSTDGYCTLVTFEPGELGVQYIKEDSEVEESSLDVSGCEELDKNDSVNLKTREKEETDDIKIKKPNILEKWAIRKIKDDLVDDNAKTDKTGMDIDKKPSESEIKKNKSVKTPKRIAPIKIGEIQHNKNNSKLDTVEVQKLVKNKLKNEKEEDTVRSKLIPIQDSKEDKNGKVENIQENKFALNDQKMVVDLTKEDENESSLTPSKRSKESNKNDELSRTPPSSKKLKIDKKNQKNRTPTSASLLRFFQPISKPSSQFDSNATKESKDNKVIEISDDECSKDKSDKVNETLSRMKKSGIITKELKVQLERSDIFDNKMTSSLPKMTTVKNTSEIEDLTMEIENNQSRESKMTEPEIFNLEQNMMETSFNEDNKENSNLNTEIVKDDLTKSETEEPKQKTRAASHPKDSAENAVKFQNNMTIKKTENDEERSIKKQQANTHHTDINVENKKPNETEKMQTEDVAGSSSKQDCIKNTQQSYSTTLPTCNPIKAKVPRRVQLITLSSPKRRKNITQHPNNE